MFQALVSDLSWASWRLATTCYNHSLHRTKLCKRYNIKVSPKNHFEDQGSLLKSTRLMTQQQGHLPTPHQGPDSPRGVPPKWFHHVSSASVEIIPFARLPMESVYLYFKKTWIYRYTLWLFQRSHGKWPIYRWFTYYKWWFSMAMLNNQMVLYNWMHHGPRKSRGCLPSW